MLQEQTQEVTTELLTETDSVEKTISIFEMIMNGGTAGIVIMAILFVLLFIAVYIYFERFFAIKAASKVDKNFMNQIREQVTSGNNQGAKILCVQNTSPVARLTEKGISRIETSMEDINISNKHSEKIDMNKLEHN